MGKYQIVVVVGSLRRGSFNRKLASAVAKLAPHGFSFSQVQIGDLPLYNQDEDGNQVGAVERLKREINSANGLLFVTPEYNRSVPGVLKNAIDHASRPYGKNAWAGKPAGVLGVSVGAIGTAMAQQHLRNILAYEKQSLLFSHNLKGPCYQGLDSTRAKGITTLTNIADVPSCGHPSLSMDSSRTFSRLQVEEALQKLTLGSDFQ